MVKTFAVQCVVGRNLAIPAIVGNRRVVGFDLKNAECLLHNFTDYGRPVRKSSLLHGQKSNPNPKSLDAGKAYCVRHIDPKFQIFLIYAFIGCL